MQENQLTRGEIAKKPEVSPQYLSRILSGTENFSIKTISRIETALGVTCFNSNGTRQ
jgi:transcriptional regulator with XRE-family HTH domain